MMDTNDLTEKAYEILKISEDIDHIITVHIGAMCSRFDQENDFLIGVKKYIQEIVDNPEDFIEEWGIEEEINPNSLTSSMQKLKSYVGEIMDIPLENRGHTIEEIDFR